MAAKTNLDPKLPKEFTSKEWYVLAPWSNLKRPKRWIRNRRLRNKFNKRHHCYLPVWIYDLYDTIGGHKIRDAYKKAVQEITEIEDNLLLATMRDACRTGRIQSKIPNVSNSPKELSC